MATDTLERQKYAELRDKLGCGYQPENPTVCKCGADTYRTVQRGVIAVGCKRHTAIWLADEGPAACQAFLEGCGEPGSDNEAALVYLFREKTEDRYAVLCGYHRDLWTGIHGPAEPAWP